MKYLLHRSVLLSLAFFSIHHLVIADPVESAETVTDDLEVDEGSADQQIALEEMARFTLALEQIHRLHATSGKPVSYEELIDGAIRGMTSQLDTYSSFMGNDSVDELKDQTRGSFVGIGVVINRVGNFVTVVSPIEGSPSWDAGLAAGDQFVAVNGKNMRGKSVAEVVSVLKGEPGTDVKVRLRRPAERKVFEVELTRALIENKSVGSYEIIDGTVGYIRVKTFNRNTSQLLRKEMTGLKKKGVSSMVLDLRGNPGGLLESAVDVSSLFLPKDTLVVSTRGKEEENQKQYITQTRPHRLEPNLVVLVNEGSASASEIVSGALQDHKRALLVGSKTFGKASVQSILPLPDGSAIRLTTARYYTPSEREIHGKGILPDEEVPLPMHIWMRLRNRPAENWDWEEDPQLRKAVELLKLPSAETAESTETTSEG